MTQSTPDQPAASPTDTGPAPASDASFGTSSTSPETKRQESAGRNDDRRSRRRFTFGILMLIVGCAVLAANLGVMIPYEWWTLWPWLLFGLGLAQFAVPGTWYERMGGYWLLIVGIYGLASTYHVFGLSWGSAWPIFVIGAGLRIVINGFFGRDRV